jgi:hypothetical protein
MRSQICCGAIEPRSANALTPVHASDVIAERNGSVLRHAFEADLPAVDGLTVDCYRPIWESYVAMLGEECYEAVRHDPELTWEERKIRQNRDLFAEHPEWLWVLAEREQVFGFVSFWLVPEKSYGHIDNNGVRRDRAGQGWATFMYRHVLQAFHDAGLRFAHVDTGLGRSAHPGPPGVRSRGLRPGSSDRRVLAGSLPPESGLSAGVS